MRYPLAAAIALAATVVVSERVPQADVPQERPLDAQVVAWDKGPDTIDVAKYPEAMKKKYKVFADLCARCHPLARAINCDFALEDDWERYIKRMMRRGGRLISPDDAQEIFDFVVYDSKMRKKALYEMKLAKSRQ